MCSLDVEQTTCQEFLHSELGRRTNCLHRVYLIAHHKHMVNVKD